MLPWLSASSRSMLWRALAYAAIVLVASNVLEIDAVDAGPLAWARAGIAHAAAGLMRVLGWHASVSGELLTGPARSVQIVNGCTGVDVGIFLAAAMLVFPAPWRARGLGVALAFAVVVAANLGRVVTLCVVERSLFNVLHEYVWPGVIVLACLGALQLWIQTLPREA